MRQLFLDTETTGLGHNSHRIVEIAAVEMIDRRLTSRHFHSYLNPDREIDTQAQMVHGLSLDFLQDKPRFTDIAEALLDFIGDAELIIHNAPFDVGFLNVELSRIQRPSINDICSSVIDSLKMARKLFPGERNSLDALCERYHIKNDHRVLHGALIDAKILAEVWLNMTSEDDIS